MSFVTYPLNNVDYQAEDAELFNSPRTSGVYHANGDFDYSITGADTAISIGKGIGWIRNSYFSGKVIAMKESETKDFGLADAVYPRIDAVVIRFDANANKTELVIKQGTPAAAPVAPEVTRTESQYELHLYHVRREAGAVTVTDADITDLRNDSNYCGVMIDSVSAIDSTLQKAGYAADAKAAGDLLRQLSAEKVEITVLWANARVSSFVAQTLTFADNDYTHFGVILGDLLGHCHPMIVLKVGDKGLATQLGGDTGSQSGSGLIMNRRITATTQTSMEFSDCKYVSVGNGSNWTELNSQLLPLIIYGIKGVQE